MTWDYMVRLSELGEAIASVYIGSCVAYLVLKLVGEPNPGLVGPLLGALAAMLIFGRLRRNVFGLPGWLVLLPVTVGLSMMWLG